METFGPSLSNHRFRTNTTRLTPRQALRNSNLLREVIVGQQILIPTFSTLSSRGFRRRPTGEAKMNDTQLTAIRDVLLTHYAPVSSVLTLLSG